MIIHVVRPGDSLYSISRRYNVPVARIAADNELNIATPLVVGQTIVVMEGTRSHTVKAGESLYSIAQTYGIPLDELELANPGVSTITPGQTIIIPQRTRKLGTIEVNGYALPTTRMEVLRKTLPYLTYLSIFSYQVRPDGSLVNIDDEAFINAARAANVAPLMVITNIKEGGSFDSDLANTILTNESVQNTLLNNVIQTIKTKRYYGLAIDFEYIYPRDRENYNNFLRKAVQRLRSEGYTVTTALAPKTSADQPGLLYEAHDYPVHGALVTHVILMTYEWGYTFSPPQAVAPINEVRRVINYAVTAIPRRKIFMGIPNYGYVWTLPHVPGTMARAISNTAAVNQAARFKAAIQYDNRAQAPFYRYFDANRKEHEVWFEDARSIQAKLRLVDEYNLGGISYWTIGNFFPQNWLVLRSLFDIRKVL